MLTDWQKVYKLIEPFRQVVPFCALSKNKDLFIGPTAAAFGRQFGTGHEVVNQPSWIGFRKTFPDLPVSERGIALYSDSEKVNRSTC